MASDKKGKLFPLKLSEEQTIRNTGDMVKLVVAESDTQVKEKKIKDESAVEDFRISCDALNWWRMHMRCSEEMGVEQLEAAHEELLRKVAREICALRGYTVDDFLSAQVATMERVRLPWGYTSLRLAHSRALRRPIRLLHPDLADAALPSLIAATALELTRMEAKKDGVIMLPIDSVRAIINQRKIVVGGAVSRLVSAGVLEFANPRYRIGKAREFRFVGKRGLHFEPLYQDYQPLPSEIVQASQEGDVPLGS